MSSSHDTMKAAESLDDLFASDDRPIHTEPVPEWGVTLRLQGLTGTMRDALEKASATGEGDERTVNPERFRARVVALGMVNSKGERLAVGDAAIDKLNERSAKVIARLFKIVADLSGFGTGTTSGNSPRSSASPTV